MSNSRRTPQLLICDDDQAFQLSVKHSLKGKYDCRSAMNSDEAKAIVKNHAIDIVLLDVEMRTPNEGLKAIPVLKDLNSDMAIVMSSGRTDFSTVREAMRLGAMDYVEKGCAPEALMHILQRVASRKTIELKGEQKDFEARAHQSRHVLVGESPQIVSLRKLIEKIKTSSANVVIRGETGTGKEVVARLLRQSQDDGSLAPFIAIDSSTIQSSTAESILFGFEKGAYTGAEKTTKGIFEESDGGIVYFDEIANMPLDIQAKLLRVIQEKEFSRLGSTRVISSDFRVICATNRDLEEMARQGSFKGDLLQRLNVLPIELPPLRERIGDIPLLVAHFLSKHSRQGLRFSDEAIQVLQKYRWPGNIRELSNLVAYVTATVESEEILESALPPRLRDATQESASTGNFYKRVESFESQLLAEEYARYEGNISRMALNLGMDRSHLYTKLRGYKIQRR